MQHIGLTLLVIFLPLSASADFALLVDLSDREIRVVIDGERKAAYPVAVGTSDYPTPRGAFTIRKLIWNPSWRPPDSAWARGKSPKPPGHPENPMKIVKMFFKEPDYYIHGTGDEDSLGRAESHGCIRMHEEDVTDLARMVMVHGGKAMPEPWYRRIFRRRTTQVVYLSNPVPIEIRK